MFVSVSLVQLKACDCGVCPGVACWAVKVVSGDELNMLGPFETREAADRCADNVIARIEETLQRSGARYARAPDGTFPTTGGTA